MDKQRRRDIKDLRGVIRKKKDLRRKFEDGKSYIGDVDRDIEI